MTRLWLLRHAPTTWSAEKRLQGRNDLALSKEGRTAVSEWHLPEAAVGCNWYVSPLQRCQQTASLLGIENAQIEPRLIEMDWGTWEGEKLGDLRDRYGTEMVAMEARGLDFRPPGGESPRDVQRRLQPWLARLGARAEPTVAVAHKGVIRAIVSLASGWDMTGRPPAKLRNDSAQCFLLAEDGAPQIDRLNLPLLP